MPGEDAEIEIRPLYELEDFGEELSPELRRRRTLQAEMERMQKR
jgi:hypothetical protein